MWLVPHYYQSNDENCGPACLRMLAAALGKQRKEQTLAKHCWTGPGGTVVDGLIKGAKRIGLIACQLWNVGYENDAKFILENAPFIAGVNWGLLHEAAPSTNSHYVVVLGLENNDVLYHDPSEGASCRVTLATFISAFNEGRNEAVRIWAPPAPSTPSPY